MATGNEILGSPINPANAFGSTELPAGANATIVDTSRAIDYWKDYAQNKFNLDKANLDEINKQRLANAAKLQKALDQGQYKLWDADKDEFNKQWATLQDTIKQPGVAAAWLEGDPSNPDYQKVQSQIDGIDQFSKFSAQQMTDFNTLESAYRLHPEMFPDDFDKQLMQYRNGGGPDYRAENSIQVSPEISFNAPAFINNLKPSGKEVLTTDKDKYGRYVDTTETVYDPEELRHEVELGLSSDKKAFKGATQAFNNLPANKQQEYGDVVGWVSTMADEHYNGKSTTRAKNPNYPPGTASTTTVPFDNEFDFTYTDPKTDEVKTVYGVNGGWDISKTGQAPANINISPPTAAHVAGTGQVLTKDQIGANAWNVDVIGITDVYKLKDGRYLLMDNNEKKNLPTERVAIVNTDAAGFFTKKDAKGKPTTTPESQTILIPYSDIATQLQNSKIHLADGGQLSPTKSTTTTIEKYKAPNGNVLTIEELKTKYGYTDDQIQQAIKNGKLVLSK